MVLHPVNSDISTLVSTCLDQFQLQATKRRFIFVKPAQRIEINIDTARINQVISNLLDNALKYSPEDRPIEITIEPRPDAVRVSVIDQGQGIPEEHLRTLFTAFSKGAAKDAFHGSTSGLGLGLAISREIIELHGGTIGVSSEAGCGSTFYFELPRKGFKS